MRRDDFYGDRFKWFVGVVKDSFGDKNRVRVRIFGVHRTDDITDVSDGDLPGALVLYPTTGGHTSGGSMSHGLKPGTWVFGFFVDGDDCQQPVIIGVIDGGHDLDEVLEAVAAVAAALALAANDLARNGTRKAKAASHAERDCFTLAIAA